MKENKSCVHEKRKEQNVIKRGDMYNDNNRPHLTQHHQHQLQIIKLKKEIIIITTQVPTIAVAPFTATRHYTL